MTPETAGSPGGHLLREVMGHFAGRVERALEEVMPAAQRDPTRLHEAMRYAVLGGGKRLRALLVYTGGQVCGADLDSLDAPACAVELLHAYSLVHDDLPAMDDDDLRRGKPSCHRAFDEATAILVGDALQSLAFEVLARSTDEAGVGATERVALIACFARASGSLGMAGGQALDLAGEGRRLTLGELEQMHLLKTGALIRASVRMGALCAPAVAPGTLDRLDEYARCVGLAFQIRDDILDVEGDTETLGKPQGSDQVSAKSTYPSLVGLEESKRLAHGLHERALEQLAGFGEAAQPLRALSEFAVTRAS